VVRTATPDRAELVLGRWRLGDFAGEWGLITGEAALLATRAIEPGLLHKMQRERFLQVISDDGELSRVIMRELLRRRDLLRAGEAAGSVEILGAAQSPASHALRSCSRRSDISTTAGGGAAPDSWEAATTAALSLQA
jgi:CRP-like cAMP-binding protein